MSNELIGLDERKALMLDMLKVFLDYCADNNLRCYLAGGTLLGAVRHKGYIPWDDDIDLMMPINDYERLIEIQQEQSFPEPYYISSLVHNTYHMWPMLKVIDTRTEMYETIMTRKLVKAQKKFFGVYIDVFPMYGLPDSREKRLEFQKQLCKIQDNVIKASRVMNRRPCDSNLSFIFRSGAYFVYTLPQKIMGWKFYLRKCNRLIKEYSINKASYWGFAVGYTSGEKDHNSTDYLTNEMKLSFEGIDCPVLCDYDAMLSRQYGDYMVLPPIEQRRTHSSEAKWK